MKKESIRRLLMSSLVSIVLGASTISFSAELLDLSEIEITESLKQDLKYKIEILQQRVMSSRGIDDALLIVGPAGSGKSSLMTLLGGGGLVAIGRDSPVLDGGLGDDIFSRHDVIPKPNIPVPWRMAIPKPRVFWDFSGFKDESGSITDIISAVSIVEVLENFQRVKILLVLEESGIILGRSGELFSWVNQLSEMFLDENELYSMTSLVITKSTPEAHPREYLRQYVDDTTNVLNVGGRNLLRYLLACGDDRIADMPKPIVEGPYDISLDNFWKVIENSSYVERPSFRASIPTPAYPYVKDLSSYLNSSVENELKQCTSFIVQALSRKVLEFNGNSDNLRQKVREVLDFINVLGSVAPDREKVLRFKDIPGLADPIRVSLTSKIEQLYTLKIIGSEDSGVFFEVDKWFSALRETMQQLQGLWDSLQVPIYVMKTPVYESFTAPVSSGIVREEETFRLPDGQNKTTFKDLQATRSLLYTHEDHLLRSISREEYAIQREKRAKEILRGNVLTVPYVKTRGEDSMASNVLIMSSNVASVSTPLGKIYCTYQRIDGSLYFREGPLLKMSCSLL